MGSGDLELDAYMLLDAAVAAPDFLNFRPSVTAAAVLYTARECSYYCVTYLLCLGGL